MFYVLLLQGTRSCWLLFIQNSKVRYLNRKEIRNSKLKIDLWLNGNIEHHKAVVCLVSHHSNITIIYTKLKSHISNIWICDIFLLSSYTWQILDDLWTKFEHRSNATDSMDYFITWKWQCFYKESQMQSNPKYSMENPLECSYFVIHNIETNNDNRTFAIGIP